MVSSPMPTLPQIARQAALRNASLYRPRLSGRKCLMASGLALRASERRVEIASVLLDFINQKREVQRCLIQVYG